MAAVKFAQAHSLALAVRGGGHSAPGFGTCDDGLVIDLRRMRGIRVDPERRTVRAEGGCTWGDLNHATYAFGLATTGGIVSTTGIAGLTLGGRMGYLARRCGLSCDNLSSADVVLADGTFVSCGEDREKDLFWAIRATGTSSPALPKNSEPSSHSRSLRRSRSCPSGGMAGPSPP